MTDWIEVDLSDGRKGRYRVTAVGPNGPVPFPQDALEPEVTFKCPPLNDPEPEMTDWIEHTTDTCPVDLETVVEVRIKHGESIIDWSPPRPAHRFRWSDPCITHYRIITPAKPRKPEGKEIDPRGTRMWTERQPDLIALRLECLKLAVNDHFYEAGEPDYEQVADRFLRYVLNGSVDKA